MSNKGKGQSYRVIDFNAHVRNNGNDAFPNSSAERAEYSHSPSSAEGLVHEMDSSGIAGALVGQDQIFVFHHTYVASIIQRWPDRFKGMCLLNPSQTPEEACKWLEELKGQGFVGVSFNPYLWEGKSMVDKVSHAVFCHAGKLNMVVEFICINGLKDCIDDICELLSRNPDTQAVIDSYPFCLDKESWMMLQSLSLYNSLSVKLTCRLTTIIALLDPPHVVHATNIINPNDTNVLKRLLFGTAGYPHVLNQCDYTGSISALKKMGLSSEDFNLIVGGNCERVFGAWGKCR